MKFRFLVSSLIIFVLGLFVNPVYGSIKSEKQKKLLIICEMQEAGGVEEVINQVRKRFIARNYSVELMGLDDVSTFNVPGMPGVKMPYPWGIAEKVAEKIYEFEPDNIFIPLHGILSYQAGCFCAEYNIPFTGFYFIRYQEVVKDMTGIPFFLSTYFTHNFLSDATNVLVPSASIRDELIEVGCDSDHVFAWPHGVELDRFTVPTEEEKEAATKACNLEGYERPFYLFVGRICKQKNIPALLNVKVPGTKIVVGPEEDGYSIAKLQKEHPDILFVGPKYGQDLVDYYKSADIFLFPSKLDSFGIVQVEALATGIPIVGFNAFGPSDVVPKGCGVSYLADNDQEFQACAEQAWQDLQAGKITASKCRAYASRFSWETAMDKLENTLVQVDKEKMSETIESYMQAWWCC